MALLGLFLIGTQKANAVDCVQYCINNLRAGLSGKKVTKADISQCSGGSARQMLNNGGSMNWPMNCYLGYALSSNDWSWFDEYIDESIRLQKYFSSEFLSPIYHQNNEAAMLAVYLKTNDQKLKQKTGSYLKANWAWQVLNTSKVRPTNYEAKANGKTITGSINTAAFSGPAMLGVGNRSGRVQGNGQVDVYQPGSLMNPILQLVLDHPERRFSWGVLQSPGWYHPLRLVCDLLGIPYGSTGKVDLKAKSNAPELFGITTLERQYLREFIDSDGKRRQKELIAMIPKEYKPQCSMALVRTTKGLTSYFKPKGCNANKPPNLAITYEYATRKMHVLKPYYSCGVGCPTSQNNVHIKDGKICGKGHYEDCIPFITGEKVLEVEFNHDAGLMIHFPKEPAPTPTPTPIPPKPPESGCKFFGFQAIILSALAIPLAIFSRRKKPWKRWT